MILTLVTSSIKPAIICKRQQPCQYPHLHLLTQRSRGPAHERRYDSFLYQGKSSGSDFPASPVMARDLGDLVFNLKSFARFFHLLHDFHDFLEFAMTSCSVIY